MQVYFDLEENQEFDTCAHIGIIQFGEIHRGGSMSADSTKNETQTILSLYIGDDNAKLAARIMECNVPQKQKERLIRLHKLTIGIGYCPHPFATKRKLQEGLQAAGI